MDFLLRSTNDWSLSSDRAIISKCFIWIKWLTNLDIDKVSIYTRLNNTNETKSGTYKTSVNELQGRLNMAETNHTLRHHSSLEVQTYRNVELN